jgi:FlaA1/EpsC-like NDP-sugar epimerase
MQLLNPTSRATDRSNCMRCLVIGAGEAGRAISRDLRRVPDFGLYPVGFLDDHAHGRRRTVGGLPVLGTTEELPAVARRCSVEAVVVAIPSLPNREIRRLVAIAAAEGLAVRYLPSFGKALERRANLGDLRRLSMDRLLGRDERAVVRLDAVAYLRGKCVLVTGAGGSIGSELCRQVSSLGAERVLLLDHDESNLHRLKMELEGEALFEADDVIIGDIRDASRIEQIFTDHRPEIIFHAAAHKHLPLLELHPCEGVKANVIGTRNLVEAAVRHGAERFVLVSTDKAASPTSVLGATKRIAELIVASHAMSPTRVAAVRFGNVLGSRGSFMSVLADQLDRGDPVTITHPDVTRYFMTVEEAVGLVLEAGAMAEFGEVFVLDMGEPVRIVDLVFKYARQLYMDADEVEVRYTGLRPGEKLHESLFGPDEERTRTAHPRIWSVRPRVEVAPDLDGGLTHLEAAAAANRAPEVRACLSGVLRGYTPARSDDLAGALGSYYPDDF